MVSKQKTDHIGNHGTIKKKKIVTVRILRRILETVTKTTMTPPPTPQKKCSKKN